MSANWQAMQEQDDESRFEVIDRKLREARAHFGDAWVEEFKSALWHVPLPEKPIPKKAKRPF